MTESVYDWDIFYRKEQFFKPTPGFQSKKSIKYNKKIGLSQNTIDKAISFWKKQNLEK